MPGTDDGSAARTEHVERHRSGTAAGVTTLGAARAMTDAGLLAWHGVGPKGVRMLRELSR